MTHDEVEDTIKKLKLQPSYHEWQLETHALLRRLRDENTRLTAELEKARGALEPTPQHFTVQWCKDNPEAASRVCNALARRLQEIDPAPPPAP